MPRANYSISMANIWERIAGKVRIIILLHFGAVAFRIHCWKTLKPFICMDPTGRDHDSQNQLFLIWETPRNLKTIQGNSPSVLKMLFGKI